MGVKDKVKNIWKKVSDLEDGEETTDKTAKGKERIPFKDISQKLKEIMKQNVDVVGRKIFIPSYYIIYFSKADRKIRIEVEDSVCDELKEELFHEMRKINPEQNKRDLIIQLQTDAELADGQFRIEHHIKKPDGVEKIPREAAPVSASMPEDERDFQQTLVEQPLPLNLDDQQKTVVQKLDEKTYYKLLIDSGEQVREQAVSKETISIGRGSKDDVVLQSPDFSISRTHATITYSNGDLSITPLGVNGTLLNDQELELNEPVPVSPGDEIKIMNYRLRIQK
jgi:hypothetical protein